MILKSDPGGWSGNNEDVSRQIKTVVLWCVCRPLFCYGFSVNFLLLWWERHLFVDLNLSGRKDLSGWKEATVSIRFLLALSLGHPALALCFAAHLWELQLYERTWWTPGTRSSSCNGFGFSQTQNAVTSKKDLLCIYPSHVMLSRDILKLARCVSLSVW